MGGPVRAAVQLGRGEHRRDPHVLPLPQQHHKHLKSTNMLERINQELKRRTLVVRIFPNAASCLRLIRALAVEIHEDWVEAIRYLNMEVLQEQLKEQRREPAAA